MIYVVEVPEQAAPRAWFAYDEADFARKVAAGDPLEPWEIHDQLTARGLLEDIGQHPDRRRVGDLEQCFAGHEAHALHRLFLGDDAGDRRAEGQRAFGVAVLRQRLDLLFGDVPVLQPLQAGLGKLAHRALCFVACLAQLADALRGEGVFALRRHQLGAVDLGQRLAARDGLAGRVHVQLLDPAFELRGDRALTALVDLDRADRQVGAETERRLSHGAPARWRCQHD